MFLTLFAGWAQARHVRLTGCDWLWVDRGC